MFLLFIHKSFGGKLREGLIWLSLVRSGDIEVNLEPKIKSQLSFCQWNLNGLAAHNFIKVSLLQVLSVTHDYDIICLSETFLDWSISNEDERICIKVTISNKKREGVCMHCKEHLPIIKRDDLCTLEECLVMEIRLGKEKFFFRVYIDHQVKIKKNLRSFVLI